MAIQYLSLFHETYSMIHYFSKRLFVAVFIMLLSTVAMAGNKKIGILVFDGVLSSDVTAPLEVFGIANKQAWFKGYEVVTIGIKDTKTIETEEGLTIGVDNWIGEEIELNALVVPSSYKMEPLLKNEKLIKFIKKTDTSAELLMSNCSGATLLAQSGILNGKKATTWAGGEKEMQKKFPKVKVKSDVNVVIDGKYLTSNGSVVSYEAALLGLAKMSSAKDAKEVFETLQMGRVTSWERIEKLL